MGGKGWGGRVRTGWGGLVCRVGWVGMWGCIVGVGVVGAWGKIRLDKALLCHYEPIIKLNTIINHKNKYYLDFKLNNNKSFN